MTNSPDSTDLHLKVMSLLDAYDTDEVSPQERQEVEVHLAACTACRQTLAEIRQLRPLLQQLGDQAARQVREGLSSSTSAPGRSSLAETVTVALTASAQEQKQSSDHSRKSPFSSPMTRKFISKRWMTGALAVAAVLLIGVVLLPGVLTGLQRPVSQSRPLRPIFDMPQTYFQQGGLIFNIKWIEVTAREFRFFYVLKAGSGEHLHASVQVVDPAHPQARALQTSVQPLGMLGVFHIGVIHAQLTNRAGQTLSLALRWEDRTQNITWTLTPLKQIYEDPRGVYADLWADQTQLRAVILIGPEVPSGIPNSPLMAVFSSVVTHGSSHTRQSIFLQVSDPLKVTLITKAQFCFDIRTPQALPELCE